MQIKIFFPLSIDTILLSGVDYFPFLGQSSDNETLQLS